jgi:hypothetical protein
VERGLPLFGPYTSTPLDPVTLGTTAESSRVPKNGSETKSQRPANLDSDFNRAKPWTRYPVGYPRFAAFMASDEDKSTTIFRRFQRLSARNLLYLESELADLEAEQDRLDALSKQDDDLKQSMKSWNLLCLQATPPSEDPDRESAEEAKKRLKVQEAAQERLHLAWRIREVLKEYRELHLLAISDCFASNC